jgi:hypothetical protein
MLQNITSSSGILTLLHRFAVLCHGESRVRVDRGGWQRGHRGGIDVHGNDLLPARVTALGDQKRVQPVVKSQIVVDHISKLNCRCYFFL